MLAGTYRTVSYLVNGLRLPSGAGRPPIPRVGEGPQRHAARHAENCRTAVIDWRPYELRFVCSSRKRSDV